MTDNEEKAINYQYPRINQEDKYKKIREVFEIILDNGNSVVLKDKNGNNIRIKHVHSILYPVGKKIYKENGIFLWERD